MADPADMALHSIEQAETIREQQRLARQARELLGLTITDCISCGDEIGQARKAAMPSAVHCIDCAERIEIKRRGGVCRG